MLGKEQKQNCCKKEDSQPPPSHPPKLHFNTIVMLTNKSTKAKGILDANSKWIDTQEYNKSLLHLKSEQCQQLVLLKNYPILFCSGLGNLKIPPIQLKLRTNAVPYNAKAYGLPKALKATNSLKIA